MSKEYKLSITKEQVNARLAQIPSSIGAEGQVLSVGENGTEWKTPAVGGIETVVVTLSTEDGEASVAGLEIAVSVEGENNTRYITTDENGKATTKVDHGLQYTIAFPTIEGYHELADVTYRSSLSVRNISEQYKRDASVDQEHVKVTLKYIGGNGSRATAVHVQVGTETNSYAVVNNVAEFDIPIGTTYEIKYLDTDSYATPYNHTYLAELHTRLVNVTYIGAVEGLSWVKYDGTSIPFNDITSSIRDSVVGLRIANSTLIEGRSTFIIPLAYLLGESSVGSKQYCAQNIQFQQLPLITDQATALLPANVDGEGNTLAVIEEARDGSATVPAGTSVPAFEAVRAIKYTINGTEIACHLGSFGEMKAFGSNYSNIYAVCLDRLGKVCININSGGWWTSTQNSATYAVELANGGCNPYNSKTNSGSVVPFLAY